MLQRWDVIKVWNSESNPPHEKYCICVCPIKKAFFFINSEPPFARKAKEYSLEIDRFQAQFLTKTSFIDTTRIQIFDFDNRVNQALTAQNHYGPISPTLQNAIKDMVIRHSALTDDIKNIILA